MGEDTVVGLPRAGGTVEEDPLLAILREGARQMLSLAIEAEIRRIGPKFLLMTCRNRPPLAHLKSAISANVLAGLGVATPYRLGSRRNP